MTSSVSNKILLTCLVLIPCLAVPVIGDLYLLDITIDEEQRVTTINVRGNNIWTPIVSNCGPVLILLDLMCSSSSVRWAANRLAINEEHSKDKPKLSELEPEEENEEQKEGVNKGKGKDRAEDDEEEGGVAGASGAA
ncbi:hypothetical protein L226DRAFT_520576 [Lentinus tigrinus ALCF2SS1-7]|uniref:uncharacterized protein n=1 Tax=Lentinus tigrinus ALCF2SS1-7 TaxID=1328758 RepID=UPI001166054F|nr:hypothetical protein L226DRAFT_520576 [Lentinus tigrinus ALCF2SS1-7]